MNDIKKVAVIGGGTMGNGIAHVFAQSGYEVRLAETSDELAERALSTIRNNLQRMVKKEKITEMDLNETMDRITTATSVEEAVSETQLVIEAVPESFVIKKDVFETIDEHAPADKILASNTSSISITKLASITSKPENFIGMHFFNPVPVMKLVEIVKGFETSTQVYETVKSLAEKIGKVPVPVNDYPGFVSNRVLMPMINEAIYCVHEGVAEPEHIDDIMKLGMAHPMGPLRLADFIGLDVCLDIMKVLYEGFRDPKYRPCPLLIKMVDAGKLGDKTGEGFFKH